MPEDIDPSTQDVLQEEPDDEFHIRPVPVVVEGLVRSQHLPYKSSSMRSIPLNLSELILPDDPRRALATIMSLDQPIVIAPDKTSATSALGMWIPARMRWEIHHTDKVFAASATGIATLVSIQVEGWSD